MKKAIAIMAIAVALLGCNIEAKVIDKPIEDKAKTFVTCRWPDGSIIYVPNGGPALVDIAVDDWSASNDEYYKFYIGDRVARISYQYCVVVE